MRCAAAGITEENRQEMSLGDKQGGSGGRGGMKPEGGTSLLRSNSQARDRPGLREVRTGQGGVHRKGGWHRRSPRELTLGTTLEGSQPS